MYRARLVDRGDVVAEQLFEATDDDAAWREAHEGCDPIADGRWVDVQRIAEREGNA